MPEPVTTPNPAFGPPESFQYTILRESRGHWRAHYQLPDDDGNVTWRMESYAIYGRSPLPNMERKLRYTLARVLGIDQGIIHLGHEVCADANRGVYIGTATCRCLHTSGVRTSSATRGTHACRRCNQNIRMQSCGDCDTEVYLDANGLPRMPLGGGFAHSCPVRRQREAEERAAREAAALEEVRVANEIARQERMAARERRFLCELGTGEVR